MSIPTIFCMNLQYHLHELILIFWSTPGHGCSPEADVGTQASTQPLPIKQQLYWDTHLLTETMECLPGMLDHGLTISSFLLTCSNSRSMASCWQGQLHCHVTWSQLPAGTKHTLMHTHAITVRLHTGQTIVILINWLASNHSDQPLTGHSDLNVSEQSHPFGLPHSKLSRH